MDCIGKVPSVGPDPSCVDSSAEGSRPRSIRRREFRCAFRGRPFGVRPLNEALLDEQHRAAGPSAGNGLLSRTVGVRDAVLPWVGGSLTSVAAGSTARSVSAVETPGAGGPGDRTSR
ncbi:hypothetical protein FMUAM8_26890 [Nocardia cyriacigeorgica]|nr:hypothetical protein FMUAM8_26890 [Nocardia cyriacigeorgica]